MNRPYVIKSWLQEDFEDFVDLLSYKIVNEASIRWTEMMLLF